MAAPLPAQHHDATCLNVTENRKPARRQQISSNDMGGGIALSRGTAAAGWTLPVDLGKLLL